MKTTYKESSKNYINRFSRLLLLLVVSGCSDNLNTWPDVDDKATFLTYRRQSQIGDETYSIKSDGASIRVKSL